MNTKEQLLIDGSQGEGGGQILRTSLALSILTKTPIRITKIRAGRSKPGLLRQHLTCVQAAATISNAVVSGDGLGSSEITFSPSSVTPGNYYFGVGSAGSTMLVLQTILLPLALADGESTVRITGGTHNDMAPPFDYIDQVYLPLLRLMGLSASIELVKPGFYPAGGGEVVITIKPCGALKQLPADALMKRGEVTGLRTMITSSGIPQKIAYEESHLIQELLKVPVDHYTHHIEHHRNGTGNVVMLSATFETGTEMFTSIGSRGLKRQRVVQKLVNDYTSWKSCDVPVGEHLADQLLLPMSLAGGGRFLTVEPTDHTRTNAAVIKMFLGSNWIFDDHGNGQWFAEFGN